MDEACSTCRGTRKVLQSDVYGVPGAVNPTETRCPRCRLLIEGGTASGPVVDGSGLDDWLRDLQREWSNRQWEMLGDCHGAEVLRLARLGLRAENCSECYRREADAEEALKELERVK